MKLLLPILFGSLVLSSQQIPTECSQNQRGCQQVNNWDGSNRITSVCYALSVETVKRPTVTVAISAATQANPVVFTSVGHGFPLGTRPQITATGGTGNWAIVNVSTTATVIDANAFSIPINTMAAGSLTGTLLFTTTAPRLTISEWAVKLYSYDGSGNNINAAWVGGNTALRNPCSGTTLTTGNSQ